jgi:hypothetical protein
MKFLIYLILLLVNEEFLFAQAPSDTASIKKQLEEIYERDQRVRKSDDSAAFRSMIDSSNLAQVEALIAKYGWMGKSKIGTQGNYTQWLVIQHADLATQEKYLPMLEKSVTKGESRGSELAYLKDRVLMRQGKKQIYGTQVVPSGNGMQEFWPIEDMTNVDKRRAEAGLEPIEQYAKKFNMYTRK